MFSLDTPLSEIKEALCSYDNYCEDIKWYFKDYKDMTYGDAISDFEDNYSNDNLMNGRYLVNLSLLGKFNDISINDRLFKVLLNNDIIRDMQLLFLWRKVKNLNNISISTKEDIINRLKGKLPRAEKQGDWDYVR